LYVIQRWRASEAYTGPHLPLFYNLDSSLCCLELHSERVLTADFLHLHDIRAAMHDEDGATHIPYGKQQELAR